MIRELKYIHFIINPIAGSSKNSISESLLLNYFPKNYFEIVINYTQYAKHAIELTKLAMRNKPDIIVACGGDGTINEVASCLVHTEIHLAIIPTGSGNGLASNLKISKNIALALSKIKRGNTIKIDVGKLNDQYFFSNAGLGIDALVIKNYHAKGTRTLSAYVLATLKAVLKYKCTNFTISIDASKSQIKPFLLFISNSNEMGYGFSLTPKAILNDGKLNLVIVPVMNVLQKLSFGLAFMLKTIT